MWWLLLRILLLAGVIPSTESVTFQATPQQLIILLLGGLLICGAVGAWVYFAPDESHQGSITALFWFTPLWPPTRFACAVWVFMGMLIMTGSMADIIESVATRQTLAEALVTLVLGLVLIGLNLVIYKMKREKSWL